MTVENGRVSFNGGAADIARCNIRLRTADRLLIRVADFDATDFEELFQGTKEIAWEELVPKNGKMHVTGKSVRSKLASVPDCQSIVKKAVVEAMRRRYPGAWFSEAGPVYRIEVAIVADRVTLTIDTTGPGLHKRGHLTMRGEAPLKETLAAAMVRLTLEARPRPGRPVLRLRHYPHRGRTRRHEHRPGHRPRIRIGDVAVDTARGLARGPGGGACAGAARAPRYRGV